MKRSIPKPYHFVLSVLLTITSISCQKKPLHELNKYAGEWRFTSYQTSQKAIELDSAGIATKFEETQTDPLDYSVKIRVKNRTDLCFVSTDNKMRLSIQDNGALATNQEHLGLFKPENLSGGFEGEDSFIMKVTSYIDYTIHTKVTAGVRLD